MTDCMRLQTRDGSSHMLVGSVQSIDKTLKQISSFLRLLPCKLSCWQVSINKKCGSQDSVVGLVQIIICFEGMFAILLLL